MLRVPSSTVVTSVVVALLAVACAAPGGSGSPATEPEAQLGSTLECPWDESDPGMRTFIVSGQSNMVAAGGIPETFPAAYRAGTDRLQMFDGGTWKRLGIPASGKWGPEIAFAWTMHAACPDSDIGFIKYAVGGTSIDLWVPGALHGSTLESKITAAWQARPGLSFEGFLFQQGGADMHTRERAESWGDDYLSIVDYLRGTPQVPDDMPFLHGTYRTGSIPDDLTGLDPDSIPSPAPDRPFAVHVSVEQWNVQAERPGVHAVVHRDLPVLGDGIHWTPDGIRAAGRNFADAFVNEAS